MKKLCRFLPVLLVVVLVFSACADTTVTYTVNDLSITLPDSFMPYDEGATQQDAAYVSDNALVTISRESFHQLGVDESFTEEDYAELVGAVNDFDLTVDVKDGHYYFAYTSNVDGDDFRYLAVIFKGEDAFYMVQFVAFSSDFDSMQDDFWSYVDTVKVA